MRIPVQNLDMFVFAQSQTVNYLHHGNALDSWAELKQVTRNSSTCAEALLDAAYATSNGLSDLQKLIRAYRSLPGKRSAKQLQHELDSSLAWRSRFHQLRCRGFSYLLDSGMAAYNNRPGRRCKIRDEVNLRYALLPGHALYYPSRVWMYLQSTRAASNHYFKNGLPSIAFCFGKETPAGWCVLLLQSDLTCEGESLLRDHFRGWRHVLAANVIAQARGKTSRILLCRAQDAERACFPGTKIAGKLPGRWLSIYDRTAQEWGMRLVRLNEPVDIQLYCEQPPLWCEYFYELLLDRDAVFPGHGKTKTTEESYVPQPCNSADFRSSLRQEY